MSRKHKRRSWGGAGGGLCPLASKIMLFFRRTLTKILAKIETADKQAFSTTSFGIISASLGVRIENVLFFNNLIAFTSRFQHSRIRSLRNISGKKATAPLKPKSPYAYGRNGQYKPKLVFHLVCTSNR